MFAPPVKGTFNAVSERFRKGIPGSGILVQKKARIRISNPGKLSCPIEGVVQFTFGSDFPQKLEIAPSTKVTTTKIATSVVSTATEVTTAEVASTAEVVRGRLINTGRTISIRTTESGIHI